MKAAVNLAASLVLPLPSYLLSCFCRRPTGCLSSCCRAPASAKRWSSSEARRSPAPGAEISRRRRSYFTFHAFRAVHPRRPGVTRRSAPAGVAWISHGAFGSRCSRLPRGSLHTWTGFTPGRGRQRLKQCREMICRGRSQRTLGHLIGWRTGGGPEELRYSLRRTSVQSLRRCWSEGDLPCNTTSRLSPSAESDCKEDFTLSVNALLLTGFPGYPGCPGCPGSPSCPGNPRGPTTPTWPPSPFRPSVPRGPVSPLTPF